MKNYSFITSAAVSALALVVLLTAAPILGGAQMAVPTYGYNPYNARPYWDEIHNPTVVQGQTLNMVVEANDENGDVLTYTAVRIPDNASFNPATRVFSFTPNFNQLGSFEVVLSATDGKSAPAYATFYVNVSSDAGHYHYGGGEPYGYGNGRPYFSGTQSYYEVNSGERLNFVVRGFDPESAPLSYTVANLPAGAGFNRTTGDFSWIPSRSQRGSYQVMFYATDGFATSVPLSVTIVVDGGTNQNYVYNPYGTTTSVAYNSTYYGSTQTTYATAGTNVYGYQNASYYYGSGQGYFLTTAPAVAVAGQTYTYTARAHTPSGYPLSYQLTVGPDGAYINASTGVLAWSVPSNATSGQRVQFTITATDSYMSVPVVQNFTVTITGGKPAITTIVRQPKTTVVQYVPTQPATPNYVYTAAPTAMSANYYPTGGPTVYINTGRVVGGAYVGSAYGTVVSGIQTFNIAVRVNDDKETIVTWDTNKPTRGEVVFGYNSQSRPSASSGQADLNRTVLNYDFTTGQLKEVATRHEVSLGKLELNRTYYLRVISRTGSETDISRELVFIPMPTSSGQVIVDQYPGAATASYTVGSFLTSTGFLFFLLLLIVGLMAYLIMTSRPETTVHVHTNEPRLNIHEDQPGAHH